MTYLWNENVYQMIKQNPNMVAWKDFATDKARLIFNDYHCIANPHLIKGSQEHLKWKNILIKNLIVIVISLLL